MFSQHFTKILLSATALHILSSCAILKQNEISNPSNWFVSLFEKDGKYAANKASLAYFNGDFNATLKYAADALSDNPNNQQALLVGALAAEKMGRYNKAREYYEDLIVIDGNDTSVLGTNDVEPQKISVIAKNRLRAITLAQTNLTIENKDGTKSFAISQKASSRQNKKAISNVLKKKSPTIAKNTNIDNLFTGEQQNIVSRFLLLKELAEKDFITKEEFLSRRRANLGGLLPLTNQGPGVDAAQPIPSPDLVIERLEILKEGVESRAITPREFSVERDIIIEALMSPNPRKRLKNKAPSKNILDAARDLRRLEVLYNLGLITDTERNAEKKAVEKYLGIKKDTPTTSNQSQTIPSQNIFSSADQPASSLGIKVEVPTQIQVPAAIQVPPQIQIPASVSAPAPIQIPASVQVTTPTEIKASSIPADTNQSTAPNQPVAQPAPQPEQQTTSTPQVSNPL
jgi:tetratricopeptide (TPR) repeat protein